MKKRLSGLILATEIAAIVMLHLFKISHQEKTDKLPKHDAVLQKTNIGITSISHSVSFSNLR
jgi:hypothetical protein